MSLSSWRQFPFFEGTPIKDPYYGSTEHEPLYSDPSISAVCTADDLIAIATGQCIIKFINDKLENFFEFQPYEIGWSITKLSYFNPYTDNSTHNGFLVTIAEKQGLPIQLKLWNLSKIMDPKYNLSKFNYNSSYHTLCNISNGANTYPLTCFDHYDNYTILCFGFSNGTVILLRGDLLHDRGSRQRIIYENKEPIMSVHFRDETNLYVTTVSKTFTLLTNGKNNGHFNKVLDDKLGSDINCACITNEKTLIVARDDNIQSYNLKGKYHAIQLNIPKRRMYLYKNRYILFLTFINSNLTENSIISNNKLIIFDLKYNYIVFNQAIAHSIFDIFEAWNDIYVFLSDGSLLKIHEKSLTEKINILKSRELFQIAIKLTNEANPGDYSSKDSMMLRKNYGNYLYNKGEFVDSINQFIQCIQLGKTSEIISKFSESSKIQYLVKYLEKLVELKVSTDNHINLLLTSYCKLKRFEEFEEFINNIKADEDFEIIEEYKKFDLSLVIQLCKDNEYYKLALLIGEKFNLSSTVVSIQLNELNNPSLTIDYIRSLGIEDLLRVLIENVYSLLNHLPNETTQLLIDVFTGKYTPTPRKLKLLALQNTKGIVKPENDEVSHPLLTSYKQFVLFMSSKDYKSSDSSTDTLSEIENQNKEKQSVTERTLTYLPPKPRIIFSNFVNHNYEFVIFLEACIASYDLFGGDVQDKKDIINTLFEIYLTLSTEDPENSKDWERKAFNLLKERDEWTENDKTSLLLTATMYNFNDGEMFIKETAEPNSIQGFELDIFRSAILSNNILKSFEILEKYGKQEPELYRLALTTYTASDSIMSEIGDSRIEKILDHIEEENILTPLEVIDSLTCGNANVKLGLIKPYILKTIEKQKADIKNNEKLVTAYESKLNDLNSQITDLLKNPKIVNNTNCSVCTGPLDFPIVYFKCGHQIHESCLIENNGSAIQEPHKHNFSNISNDNYDIVSSCPICLADQDALSMLKKQQDEVSERQDLFETTLKNSTDRFKTIFGFLGRGGLETNKFIVNNHEFLNG